MALHHIKRALLGFIDVFPNETPQEKNFYISKIGSQTIYHFCTYFLGKWRIDQHVDIDQLLKDWFTYNTFDYTQSPSYYVVEVEIRRLKRKYPSTALQLIMPEAILNLFLWIRNNARLPEKGPVNDDASITIEMFRLILLFNQEVNSKVNKAKKSVSQHTDRLTPYRELLATQFPQWDLNSTDYAQLFYSQIFKLARLLDFLANTPEYQALHAHLLSEFGLSNNKDYMQGVATLPASRLSSIPGKTTFNVPTGPNYARDVAFLEKFAIQPDQPLPNLPDDFLSLRSAPLVKIKEGVYDVLFDPFLLKKVYNGLVFLLSSWCPKGNVLFTKGDFLGSFREDFSEEYLMYDVLSGIYKTATDILIIGKQFKAIQLDREPDMYIRRDKQIMLFESKDLFMKGEEKLSYNFETIEGGLKKDGRFGKAVKQLATNVGRALKKEFMLDTAYNENDAEIFPNLVVHDSLYSCPLFNFWVNEWFQEELAVLQAKPEFVGIDFSKVQPLTVIEIDSLILYQEPLSDERLDLSDMINRFHVHIGGTSKYTTFQDCWTHAYQQISFSEAIRVIAYEKNIEIGMSEFDSVLQKIGLT